MVLSGSHFGGTRDAGRKWREVACQHQVTAGSASILGPVLRKMQRVSLHLGGLWWHQFFNGTTRFQLGVERRQGNRGLLYCLVLFAEDLSLLKGTRRSKVDLSMTASG